jgi:hypothetical protein
MKKGDLVWVWSTLSCNWFAGLLLTNKDKHEMYGILMAERVMQVHNCYIEFMTDDGKQPSSWD